MKFLDIFWKNSQILSLLKVRPVGAELFHADGQTDMTKLIVAFRNFANAPKNEFCSLELIRRGPAILNVKVISNNRLCVSPYPKFPQISSLKLQFLGYQAVFNDNLLPKFRKTFCLHLQCSQRRISCCFLVHNSHTNSPTNLFFLWTTLQKGAIRCSETSVTNYRPTWPCVPEDCNF